ncbi:MAG: hypothetical protein GVY16_02130 [Planctomycetes bacterium]|jgi:hypothetical protein|nr:hypothetical protein [Phycisphaerae bacterium]NBB94519.1 hypothetical protein [Planctomycetota bacterium]
MTTESTGEPTSSEQADASKGKPLQAREFQRLLQIREAVQTGQFEKTTLDGSLGSDEEATSEDEAVSPQDQTTS